MDVISEWLLSFFWKNPTKLENFPSKQKKKLILKNFLDMCNILRIPWDDEHVNMLVLKFISNLHFLYCRIFYFWHVCVLIQKRENTFAYIIQISFLLLTFLKKSFFLSVFLLLCTVSSVHIFLVNRHLWNKKR
jgi:hypothetical protein